MNLKKNKKKIINIYSITDWDYHNGKVSWDDFFDEIKIVGGKQH